VLKVTQGDLLHSDAETLVNPVNAVGVMGKGLALQFKRAFPDNFQRYKAACKRGEVVPGRVHIVERDALCNPRYIINFPTKRHWREPSRLADIESGLEDLARAIRERSIRSIAVPPLGCGNGGLAWTDVLPRIERVLGDLGGIAVFVYEPNTSSGAK